MSSYEYLNQEGKFDKILDLTSNENGNEEIFWKITALFRLGMVEQSLDLMNKYKTSFKNDTYRCRFLNISSTIHKNLGNYQEAIEMAFKCLESLDRSKDFWCLGKAYSNIAEIYRIRGEIDKALKYFHEGYSVYKNNKIKLNIQIFLLNLGTCYRTLGRLDEAEIFLSDNYKIALKLANPQYLTYSLVEIIEVIVRKNKSNKDTTNYLNKIEEIAIINKTNSRIQLHYKYAKALYYKFSKRNRDKINAELIFEDLIKTNKIELYYTLESIPHLVELLLYEYNNYKENEVLKEILSLLQNLYNIGKEEQMQKYLIKSLILQSKLSLIEGDLMLSKSLLQKAIDVGEKHNLNYLLNEINVVKSKMHREMQEMNEMVESNPMIIEQVKITSMINYLRHVQGVLYEN